MDKSDNISEIAQALAKAQGQFTPATKSKKNDHLKNSYATLDDVINSIRKPLSDNGLSFIQSLQDADEGLALETVLFHASGEWISSCVSILRLNGNRGVNELQAFGGSLTYMRRYALSALLGINTEEDKDGNGGTKKKKVQKPPQKRQPAKPPVKKKTETKKPTAPTNGTKWIDNAKARAGWYAWLKDEGVEPEKACEILEVKAMHDYAGHLGEAKMAIMGWKKAQQNA